MATIHRYDIARLLPTTPPGADLAAIHAAARQIWPTICHANVLDLLRSLVADGHAVRADTDPHRYHLTESS